MKYMQFWPVCSTFEIVWPDAPRLVLFQICLAWAVVSVSIRAATSQTDEVDPDSEVDVFLPALAKKLAKRSTTRKFRLVTTGSSSVAEVNTDGPDPNKAGKLAVINFGGGQRRRQQQQRRRNRNNNNNNNNLNANNFNNNNILNSNPMMVNGTSYGVANPNPIQRRTNQRRRQQQVKNSYELKKSFKISAAQK